MAEYNDKELYEDDELEYNEEPQANNDDLQKTLKGYRIIIIALVAVLGLLTFQHFRVTSDIKEEFRIERDTLNSQISGLITEIDSINLRNDAVTNELRAHIAAERDKADSLMTRLKKERNINREKIRQYEKELGTLRTIMRRYVHQIDSLNTLNKKLADENITIRKRAAEETTRANIAEERAQEMANKIKLGSIVKARGIVLGAYNVGGTNVTRASRASKFRTDLTLTANELTIPGKRSVYVRILGPDGAVLSGGADNIMEFEGDLISYSAEREVDYDNKDLDVSVFFNYDGITSGLYKVEVYMDGYLIGENELALR
ncbi:MAG: hypothetical protein J6U53_04495 [Tidjanibacter sp.]|nr:hypothetical protein [Tidjanibacter sp.]